MKALFLILDQVSRENGTKLAAAAAIIRQFSASNSAANAIGLTRLPARISSSSTLSIVHVDNNVVVLFLSLFFPLPPPCPVLPWLNAIDHANGREECFFN